MDTIKIIPFEDRFAEKFKQLNMDWLKGFDLFEPADLNYLDTPWEFIIHPGGRILIATVNDRVVGTCAIVLKNGNTAELAKLAVSKQFQGRGIGRKLVLESIKQARDMGIETIILVSNKKLSSAIRLYEQLGFEHAPMPPDIDYETADVYMTFSFSAAGH